MKLELNREQKTFAAFASIAIVLCSFLIALSTLHIALLLFVLVVGVPFILLFFKNHHVGMTLVVLSIVAGNLVRFTLGGEDRGAAILLSDLFIPLLVFAWAIRKLVQDREFNRNQLNAPIIVFILVALISWFQGLFVLKSTGELVLQEAIVSFMYWGRFVEYALLFFVAVDLIKTKKEVKYYLYLMLGVGILVAIGGFIQLVVMPDFTKYAVKYGWDPHQDRLLSTFFDPNFVATFLAIVITLALSWFLYEKKISIKSFLMLVILVCGLAWVLTYSRTGFVALLMAGGVIALLRSKIFIFVGIGFIILVLAMSPRSLSRITEGLSLDETGVKRIESWSKGLTIIPKYPLLGTGYNTFAFVQDDLGMVDEFDVNNRGGLENSLLTIFVTTGIIGLLAYIWLYFKICWLAYLNWKNKALPKIYQGINLGILASLLGLLVSSIFINSLLYNFLLIYFWIMAAITVNTVKESRSRTQEKNDQLPKKQLSIN